MVLDYSKWDKLELSDDSDIEGHPNVDKASLIRWKQQDIHAKRQQRTLREKQLRLNIETNTDLLERIEALVTAVKGGRSLKDVGAAVVLARGTSTKQKPELATSSEQPLYDDMIESLVDQVNEESDALKGLQKHRKMIEDALGDEKKELAGIEFEKSQHITTEDIRDGWNSTVFNKPKVDAKETNIETIGGNGAGAGSGSKAAATAAPSPEASSAPSPQISSSLSASDDSLEPLLPETKKFGELPASNLEMSGSYLVAHPHIIKESQKDALIMTAFDAQLAGKDSVTKNIIHQSLLIQYSAILGGVDGARKFIAKIADPKHPARIGFDEEVRTTTQHIQNRCSVLQQEDEQESQEGVEQIQLHAVDPSTEISVQIPEKNSPGYAIYEQFSDSVKAAIQHKSLEAINKVLAEMSLEAAEDLVSQLSESGVLLVEEKVYNVDEWQQIQQELSEEDASLNPEDVPSPNAQPPASGSSTIDELD